MNRCLCSAVALAALVLTSIQPSHAQTTASPPGSSITPRGRDLLIDFGSAYGQWGYAGATGTWSGVHAKPNKSAVRADTNGNGVADTVIDFGSGIGIWSWQDDRTWKQLHGTAASWMLAADIDGSGRDDLIVDFGASHGIWIYRDAGTWVSLHGSTAKSAITMDFDHNGRSDVVIDFGSAGIWAWMNNATWQPIHGTTARWMLKADLDRNGQDDLVVDFGTRYGIWLRYNGGEAWTPLHGASAKSGVAADLTGSGYADTLVIDFGSAYGIWKWGQTAGWSGLHAVSAKGMVAVDTDASGRDDVVIDFGSPYGIWRWGNDSAWNQLHGTTASHLAAVTLPAATPAAGPPTIGGCPMFPEKAIVNQRVDDRARFPVHAQNAAWIAAVGATRRFHADWGMNDNPQQYADYYGIPYNVIDGTAASTAWPNVIFPNGFPDESDCALAQGSGYAIQRGCDTVAEAQRRFPFPLDTRIKLEGGACGDPATCGDRHVLVVEQGSCRLWESWLSYKVGGVWTSGSTAAWSLRSYEQRPDTWTSSDAAGLPILPLLARVDEASAGEVRHALRVTFLDSVLARAYVWPARHSAGGATTNGIPFGALLRLRSDFVVPTRWTTQAQALARAMQRYGLYVADIGSNLYVQGEPSAQWNAATITQLQTLQMDQFEFVDISSVTSDSRFSAGSLQGAW